MTPPSTSSGFPMVRTLTVVSLLCGLLIVLTDVNTRGRIRHNQEIIMQESVAQLLPGIQKQIIYGIEPSGDLTISSGLQGDGPRLFAGYDAGGRFLGVVIEASERGYADVVSAMYAYDPDKKVITGFKVIDMKETPGLGNRIGSDPEFTSNFKALDASDGPFHHNRETRHKKESLGDRRDFRRHHFLPGRGTHARCQRQERRAGGRAQPGPHQERRLMSEPISCHPAATARDHRQSVPERPVETESRCS